MKKATTKKPYWEMNTEELAEATKEFDKPIPAKSLRPLSKEQRARFERAQRLPHRSIFVLRDSEGATFVRLEPSILKRASRYAAAHQLTLSEVINKSLKGMLAFVER